MHLTTTKAQDLAREVIANFIALEVGGVDDPTEMMVEQANDLLDALADAGIGLTHPDE